MNGMGLVFHHGYIYTITGYSSGYRFLFEAQDTVFYLHVMMIFLSGHRFDLFFILKSQR